MILARNGAPFVVLAQIKNRISQAAWRLIVKSISTPRTTLAPAPGRRLPATIKPQLALEQRAGRAIHL